jgi:hypothetical protein
MEPAAVGFEHVDLTTCPVRLANTKAQTTTFAGCPVGLDRDEDQAGLVVASERRQCRD